jgi:amino acid adenylation domain-containing protein
MTTAATTCIHQLFHERVRERPEAIAATCRERSLTYAQLDAQAESVARALRALGVQRESLVALYAPRGLELIVGVIGILKAGAAYVPLDDSSPEQRVEKLLGDCSARVVVTTSAYSARFEQTPGRSVLVLGSEQLEKAAAGSASGHVVVPGESAAYVIYTSGSTGDPKGVVVEHGNVLRLLDASQKVFDFGPDDVWTLFHSIAFDFSVWELWGALLHGGRLVIVPSETTRDPSAFLELLERESVTVLNQTPSAFQQLSRADALSSRSHRYALRHVVFGGEALDPLALRGWVERHGDASPQLTNMYGITETTVHVTHRKIVREDTQRCDESPIGVALEHLYVRLLDASAQPVPAGDVGELYIGGAGVARGYLKRPELTAERFLRDPFASDPNARLYRSGDLGRLLSNGEIAYLGRADAQLKVRGYRVEPGEIEHCLRRNPSVSSVHVLAHDHGEGDRQLVAYVVSTSPEARPTAEALRAFVRARLPEYMCPSMYVFIEAVPLTPNGKVDKARLPPLESAARTGAAAKQAHTPVQLKLLEIWSRVLDVPQLGLHDDFFELGGTSLGAVKILLAIKEHLGVALDMSLWSEISTVAGFAGACAMTRHSAASGPTSLNVGRSISV